MKFLRRTQPWCWAVLSCLISNDSRAGRAWLTGAFSLQLTAGTVWSRPMALGEVTGLACSPGCPGSSPDGYLEETRIASNALLRSPSLCRVGQRSLRPVLKHGPRSLTCMRAIELTKLKGVVKAKSSLLLEGGSVRRTPATSH